MQGTSNNKKIIFVCICLIVLVLLVLIFKKTNENKQSEFNTDNYVYLKNYKSNEYVPLYITESDVVKKYLNEFRNNMLYDVEEAYNSLNREYRVKRFETLDGYKEYLNKVISSSTFSMEVDKYSVSYINGYKIFNIYDKNGRQYIIKEISIMNYEVYLDQNTVSIK